MLGQPLFFNPWFYCWNSWYQNGEEAEAASPQFYGSRGKNC